MASNPLDRSNVTRIITKSLGGTDENPASRAPLRNATEAIAVLSHACMVAVDFKLLGFEEDDRIDEANDLESLKALPSQWSSSTSSLGFRYSHNQSAMKFLLRINRLGGKIVIMALGLGDDKTATLELVTKDWISESFFSEDTSSSDSRRPVEEAYISPSRISDLIASFKSNIIQKLVPGLHKPGYEEAAEAVTSTSTTTSSSNQRREGSGRPPRPPGMEGPGDYDPLRIPSRGGPPRPFRSPEDPPGFEDEYEINRPPGNPWGFPSGGVGGGRNPYRIGDDDLNPPGLGANPTLRGPFFGEEGGNGMFVGPNHPMFGGRQGGGVPDPRFPPGSRYDPVGPGGGPQGGFGGPRGRFPRGPGGGFGGFGSGDFI
ncbi:hypothetical protein TWF706_008295 [Orbilia oligospora]|uniref:Uncharacterized protein n=1 Tax=Orbilia oligospora TaxID=2813651 RepID=A0A7C8P3F4_ORBOL|nr:hypothetical protein TWF706_008295 [Orbilia oligospora]KAF3146048.1 hypothetical protein TWF703_005594 [Orbilia oligospora]